MHDPRPFDDPSRGVHGFNHVIHGSSHYTAPLTPPFVGTTTFTSIATLPPAHNGDTTADGVEAFLNGSSSARPAAQGIPGAFLAPGLYRATKRALDIVLATLLLIALTPLILLVALVVRMSSPGPLVFAQVRLGRSGRPFRLYKFRSMVVQAEIIQLDVAHLNEASGPMFKIRRDPRVTRVGAIMRKLSIDEVPQLVNVLRGEMTLVGPRPSLPTEVANFTDYQRRRLEVKPGLTCLWQVNGRSDLAFDEWVELDVEYIRRQSLWLDLKILARTIPAVITGRGAY